MSLFPSIPSSLSVEDSIELIEIIKESSSQTDVKIVEDFVEFVSMIANEVKDEGVWGNRMKEAHDAMAMVIPIVSQSFSDKMRISAFTTMTALSFATSQSSTLNHFRTNSEEIVNDLRFPFVLNNFARTMLGIFTSSIMLFWLSYDQLDAVQETRDKTRKAFEQASLFLSLSNVRCLLWMKEVTRIKFDKDIRLELTSEGVEVINKIPNADGYVVSELKSIQTTDI